MRKELTAKLAGLGFSDFFLGVLFRQCIWNACVDLAPDWELASHLHLEPSVTPRDLCIGTYTHRECIDLRKERLEEESPGRTHPREGRVWASEAFICVVVQVSPTPLRRVLTQWRQRVGLIQVWGSSRGHGGHEHHQDHGNELGW